MCLIEWTEIIETMSKLSAKPPILKINRQQLLVLVVLVLAIYVVVPQLGDFRASWKLLSQPDLLWTGVAVGLSVVTYAAGAFTYKLLAFKRLKYGEIFLVQLAAMFVNRLLPAGVGALGANFVYLRHRGHTIAQAGSVLTVNNILGLAGHSLLIGLTIWLLTDERQASNGSSANRYFLIGAFVGLIMLAIITVVIFGRHKVARTFNEVVKQLGSYRRRLKNVVAALGSSMLLTLANAACLGACALALDINLSFAAIFLVFSFGIGAATATPTPGGLGGFEAGLVAGFVAYDVDGSAALAAALLFRLITYWLAMAVGGIAFVICQRRGLLSV